MTILAAPARIRGIGRLVYGGDYENYRGNSGYGTKYGTRRLGDAGIYQIPQVAPKPDMDHVLSPVELGEVGFKSGDEAIAYYTFLVRTIALMTKMAFAADLWKTIKQSPEMVGALAVSENGRAWIEAFVNSEAAFLSLSQPIYFQNLQLLRNHLEVNVLPKQFKIDVKGRLPMFISGATTMSYSDVSVSVPDSIATLNFGDLQDTSVKSDAEAINEVAGKFNVKPRMGELSTIAIGIIAFVVFIIATYVFIGWSDYLQAKKIPPEVIKAIEKADPATVERILDKWSKLGGVFGGVADVFMWGAIGLGIMVVGGGMLWYASK